MFHETLAAVSRWIARCWVRNRAGFQQSVTHGYVRGYVGNESNSISSAVPTEAFIYSCGFQTPADAAGGHPKRVQDLIRGLFGIGLVLFCVGSMVVHSVHPLSPEYWHHTTWGILLSVTFIELISRSGRG